MIRMFAAPAAHLSGTCLSGAAAWAATDLAFSGVRL